MSDQRFNLARFRAKAEATAFFTWIKTPCGSVTRSERRPATREVEELREGMIALVEAVGAARESWRQVIPNANDRFQVAAHDKVRDALAKFDFGDES